MITTHNLGFPRIGVRRELKEALESYWKGLISQDEMEERGKIIRQANLQMQASLNFVPVGDFSWYDHVLDMSILLGVIPPRFKSYCGLELYFQMARGGEKTHPCEMTKWFDTNYHYIVPEFHKRQLFKINSQKLLGEVNDALSWGYQVKPVILGPLSFLWLGKCKGELFDKLELLNDLTTSYRKLLSELKTEWVQIDEPILTLDLPEEWQAAFRATYAQLANENIRIMLTTYFGSANHHAELICSLPVSGIHLDCVQDPEQIDTFIKQLNPSSILSLGVVNGRNVWKCPLNKTKKLLKRLSEGLQERLWIAGSCSFLHVPVDLSSEEGLNDKVKDLLAFAKQKIDELTSLQGNLDENDTPSDKEKTPFVQNLPTQLRAPFSIRNPLQQQKLQLPLFPTTTVGSFPQTPEIRAIRRDFKEGRLNETEYIQKIKDEIAFIIQKQEILGLDVLVHGEPERSDMVEYFAEQLAGFALTSNGWVQSYGSRCVKPPIIYDDVKRVKPMTVDWILYAQSLTKKPVKGMLTGPTTMVCWSFVREDQPKLETAKQIAWALRLEVDDLARAGIRIIQIDEPALREGLPLRKNDWRSYLDGAVQCFKIASSGVENSVQIHAHMCYSEFNDIIDTIAALDADVISIESSRSEMELLKAFELFDYPNAIGPGVYDVHSPRVPSVEEVVSLLEKAAQYLPISRIWVNPDCGLKTRDWAEVEASLKNMVLAAAIMRMKYSEESHE